MVGARAKGEKGGGEEEKTILLPDIMALFGNYVRWQTELLISAA